jgi:HEAT repeat protein
MNRLFAKSLACVEAQFPDQRIRLRIRRARIKSTSDLIRAAERVRTSSAGFSIWLLDRLGGPRAQNALLRVLGSRRRSLWMQAAVLLSMVGTANVVSILIRMMRRDREPVSREASAYALGYINPGGEARAAIQALVSVLDDLDIPRVRAQAAESLTQLLRFRRGRLRAASERVLIQHLSDADADVRFWCAYAVGELRTKAAVSSLRQLVNDRTVVPGWWSVGREARDALEVIAGGTWNERIGRAV